MNWVPSHIHTHLGSPLDGFISIPDLVGACQSYKYNACMVTDHRSVSAAIPFHQAMTKAGVKPILGNEFDISPIDSHIKDSNNKKHSHLVVLAKNYNGWQRIMKATTLSNHPDNFYYRPRLDISKLAEFAGDIIAFSGHPGSILSDILYTDISEVYACNSEEHAESLLVPNAEKIAEKKILEYQSYFGEGNFFIEIQLIDSGRMHCEKVTAKILRQLAQKLGIPTIATADSHYVYKADALYQRILLCENIGLNYHTVQKRIAAGEKVPLSGFFISDNYHLPTLDEMLTAHAGYEHELDGAVHLANLCENYSIQREVSLPKYPDTPTESTDIECLRNICRDGWKNKIASKIPKSQHGVYAERVKHELSVLEEYDLAGYFLIVQDYINWAKSQGQLVGVSRGSAGGSLVAYLSGITGIDPIKHQLIFSRFLNRGRLSKTNREMPDIDTDFPQEFRQKVIEYLEKKYGEHRVCHIATFLELGAAQAIKSVLRAYNVCAPEEADAITKHLPKYDQISDKMEEEKENSVIMWTLRNLPEVLGEWCVYNNEEFTGVYSEYIQHAIRLEGVVKATGKHASGIVVSSDNLSDICPMLYDKETGKMIAAVSMDVLKYLGMVKFDILGLKQLDKLMYTNKILSGELQC